MLIFFEFYGQMKNLSNEKYSRSPSKMISFSAQKQLTLVKVYSFN